MSTNHQIKDRTSLLDVLWDIQKKRRFINNDDVSKIATAFQMSKIEVEGVISFYHFFHRQDAGKYTIYLNNSIISKCQAYDEVKEAFEKELGIKCGMVTKDKMFGLFDTSCIGLSDQETSALINYHPFTNLTPEKVKNIIARIKEGHPLKSLCNYPEDNIRYHPSDALKTVFFKPFKIGEALKIAISKKPEQVIQKVKDSKLSGRGGAFFPTGAKWQFCRDNVSDRKFIICNADEGEPGTFKDRVLLNTQPEMLLEGMIIAGYAVGAKEGYIYLRAEYTYLKEKLERTIKLYNKKGLLGKSIMGAKGFDFSISIFMGAGAYICGEETALIASMEGKRGEPTTKEYFPVEHGYLGKPTVVNNVETLCAVPRIMSMDLQQYLSIGTEATPGTKLMSVSGDCVRPGVYEIEWGMNLRDFLKLIGANNPNLILYNGFAGECLSPADFDRDISGKTFWLNTYSLNLKTLLNTRRK
jgi:[NiFe] hydrogenase diaphorase moiety large subunit